MTAAVFILTAFVIGYLLGDRRGVRECNAILDHNTKALLQVIGEPITKSTTVDPDDEPKRPTVH